MPSAGFPHTSGGKPAQAARSTTSEAVIVANHDRQPTPRTPQRLELRVRATRHASAQARRACASWGCRARWPTTRCWSRNW